MDPSSAERHHRQHDEQHHHHEQHQQHQQHQYQQPPHPQYQQHMPHPQQGNGLSTPILLLLFVSFALYVAFVPWAGTPQQMQNPNQQVNMQSVPQPTMVSHYDYDYERKAGVGIVEPGIPKMQQQQQQQPPPNHQYQQPPLQGQEHLQGQAQVAPQIPPQIPPQGVQAHGKPAQHHAQGQAQAEVQPQFQALSHNQASQAYNPVHAETRDQYQQPRAAQAQTQPQSHIPGSPQVPIQPQLHQAQAQNQGDRHPQHHRQQQYQAGSGPVVPQQPHPGHQQQQHQQQQQPQQPPPYNQRLPKGQPYGGPDPAPPASPPPPPSAHKNLQETVTNSLTVTVTEKPPIETYQPRPLSKMSSTEQTFIAIKPDGVQRGLIGPIISRFESRGFKLAAIKLITPGKAHLEKHYSDLSDKPFFAGLIEYMNSGPICAMVWEGRDAVKTGRTILGATNPLASAPGTIRGDYAIDVGRNVCHGSDSVENAKKEIALWFSEGDVISWKSSQFDWVYEKP